MTLANSSPVPVLMSTTSNTILPRLWLFAASCLASLSVIAAPVIQSVDGDLLLGSEIKIRGKGFSSDARAFDIKDSSDSYSMLTLSRTLSVAGTENLWMTEGSPWASPLRPTAVDDPNRSGFVYQGKGKTYNQFIRPLDAESNDTLYVSWLYKPSESPGHSGGSNKFIRVWDNSSGADTRISWTGMHMTYSGSEKPSWAGWSGAVNQWNKMELWVDGPSGKIEARINGSVVHNIDNFVKTPNGIGLNIKLLGFDPSSATPYENMITQIDDLYISTTRARVILSEQPNWSDAMLHGEAVLPTSWADSEIVLNLDSNQRDFSKKMYVYVVDKQGLANTVGYELCAMCPKPPQLTAN